MKLAVERVEMAGRSAHVVARAGGQLLPGPAGGRATGYPGGGSVAAVARRHQDQRPGRCCDVITWWPPATPARHGRQRAGPARHCAGRDSLADAGPAAARLSSCVRVFSTGIRTVAGAAGRDGGRPVVYRGEGAAEPSGLRVDLRQPPGDPLELALPQFLLGQQPRSSRASWPSAA